MAYEFIQETEQPKKSLGIKRIKVNLPKSEFLPLLIILLIPAIMLSILVLHTAEPMAGILIGLTLYYVLRKEDEKMKNIPQSEAKGEVKIVDLPES